MRRPTQVPVSPARIARLKRYDMNWQAALGRLETSRLTPEAKTDLARLVGTIADNLAQLDADARTMAQVVTVVPFAPTIVKLVEARIRVDDMNAQRAAAEITAVTKEIARLTAAPPRVNAEQARLGATAVDQLRTITAEWFNFYNGYDPLFTWWMAGTYAKADEALKDYAALLRDKVAAENLAVAASPASSEPVAAAAQPPFSDVPDLNEILALPQDEMRDIVQRFTGATSGRGARGMPGGDARDKAFYTGWLSALPVARLRQAVAQRAGRLPVHPPHGGNAAGARQPEARSQPAAQARHDRHCRACARARRPAAGPVGSDDSLHARRS